MSSTFGTLFKVSSYGESHCFSVGVTVDGVPGRMPLTEADIQPQLDRRRPGQSSVSTPRNEADQVQILSGTENGLTLGTPIGLMVKNKDQRPGDYKEMTRVPRPSHADFTYMSKYHNHAASGGGRSSARETIARVAAGAIAEKFLKTAFNTEIVAWVSSVENIDAPALDVEAVTREQVDSNIIRCPDEATAQKMIDLVHAVREDKDSVGGTITCVCRNVPVGLGEPAFDKLDAVMAHGMLSIPATKGFEIGSGFAGTRLRGSTHNDAFVKKGDALGTATNNSGGSQGGISNGEPIVFRVAFKPTATIGKAQKTVDEDGNETVLEAKGRHDPCVIPRAVPIVESMASLVLADFAMRQMARDASTQCFL